MRRKQDVNSLINLTQKIHTDILSRSPQYTFPAAAMTEWNADPGEEMKAAGKRAAADPKPTRTTVLGHRLGASAGKSLLQHNPLKANIYSLLIMLLWNRSEGRPSSSFSICQKHFGKNFWIHDLELALETYQVTELEHQKIGDCFYTLSDTLEDIWMLKDTGKK